MLISPKSKMHYEKVLAYDLKKSLRSLNHETETLGSTEQSENNDNQNQYEDLDQSISNMMRSHQVEKLKHCFTTNNQQLNEKTRQPGHAI